MDSDYIRVFIPGHKMMPNAWHHKKLATIVSLMHLSSMGFLVHDQSLSRSLKSLIPRADATIDFSTTTLPLRTQLPFHLVLPAHGYLLRTDALKHARCFFICKCKWPRCAQKAEKIINAVFFLIFEAIWKQERFSGVKKKKKFGDPESAPAWKGKNTASSWPLLWQLLQWDTWMLWRFYAVDLKALWNLFCFFLRCSHHV